VVHPGRCRHCPSGYVSSIQGDPAPLQDGHPASTLFQVSALLGHRFRDLRVARAISPEWRKRLMGAQIVGGAVWPPGNAVGVSSTTFIPRMPGPMSGDEASATLGQAEFLIRATRISRSAR